MEQDRLRGRSGSGTEAAISHPFPVPTPSPSPPLLFLLPPSPGVFTDVAAVLPWIDATVAELSRRSWSGTVLSGLAMRDFNGRLVALTELPGDPEDDNTIRPGDDLDASFGALWRKVACGCGRALPPKPPPSRPAWDHCCRFSRERTPSLMTAPWLSV